MSLHDASRADVKPPQAAPVRCERHKWEPDVERGAPWVRCKKCGVVDRAELRNRAAAKRFAPIGIERRYSTIEQISIDEATRTFEGYAVRWGVKNSHKEIFEKGAFARTLGEWAADGDLPSFYLGHDWSILIGEWTEMREDDTGLFVKGRFIKSPWGDHGVALVREKIATGLSIGFFHNDYEVENEQDWPNRTIRVKEVTLLEVSLVEHASDPSAGVTHLRSIRADMTVREIEEVLGSLPGMPRGAAKAMASRWIPKAIGRDVHDLETNSGAEGETDEARDVSGQQELVELLERAAATLKAS